MRQVKEKWPTNCSRSCARKAQHARNHHSKRVSKCCPVCKTEFTVTNWDKDKQFCSLKCHRIARFGDRSETIKKVHKRLETQLRDENYMKYISSIAWRIATKWGRGEIFVEDLKQEYFLALSEGQNTTIENVAKSFLRKELKRGITGVHDAEFNMSTMDAMPYIKENYKKCSTSEFVSYLNELLSFMNDFDKKLIILYLKGFTRKEVMTEIRKSHPIGNEKFDSEKRRIFKEIDYSSWGDNYLSYKEY